MRACKRMQSCRAGVSPAGGSDGTTTAAGAFASISASASPVIRSVESTSSVSGSPRSSTRDELEHEGIERVAARNADQQHRRRLRRRRAPSRVRGAQLLDRRRAGRSITNSPSSAEMRPACRSRFSASSASSTSCSASSSECSFTVTRDDRVGFVDVVREQALIQRLVRLQRGPLAEQAADGIERRHVARQHDEAGRDRRRDHEPDGPPEPRPEDRGDDDGERRQADALPVEQRLHDVVAQELEHDEQRDDERDLLPTRRRHEADRDRQQRRDPRPDVRDVAQHAGREPPQRGVRHADEVESDADGKSHRGVDDELHQQIAADPRAGIGERFRRDDERRPAREADEPIAQVLAIDEHEDREQQREPDGADGAEQRAEPLGVAEQRRRLLER